MSPKLPHVPTVLAILLADGWHEGTAFSVGPEEFLGELPGFSIAIGSKDDDHDVWITGPMSSLLAVREVI